MFHRAMVVAMLMASLAAGEVQSRETKAIRPPNFIVLYADDLGYGDLSCYGHPTIRTPNLDRLAAEGLRLTSFYSAASVCTPSRAALLTGRLPVRNGMCHDRRRVLFPNSAGGLPDSEITIAEALKPQGYATICIGKWHLGHLPQYLPTRQGFDSYFGIPYSNDMDRVADRKLGRSIFLAPKIEYWNVPLMRDERIVERPANQPTLTRRYTQEAVQFIRRNKSRPFFLYLAYAMPHVPLFASTRFRGVSRRGLFGDVVEEIDWSVGEVAAAVRAEGIAENTLLVFSSDNGPWLIFGTHGGSAGLLRDGKGSTWEGGVREPCIMWWPGTIAPGRISADLACTMDLLPTFVHLAGGQLPDRTLDGVDLSDLLLGRGPSQRSVMYYYRGTQLYAVRKGPFKAHFITRPAYGRGKAVEHDPPLLFHLEHDPSERFDIAKDHSDIVKELAQMAEKHRRSMTPGVSQLDKTIK